jgi:hypothetical protein
MQRRCNGGRARKEEMEKHIFCLGSKDYLGLQLKLGKEGDGCFYYFTINFLLLAHHLVELNM